MPKPPEPRRPESLLPLPPATFDILLTLADGEQHGYAIMKAVAERTSGTVRLGPGTLYGALKRLLATGVVEEIDRRDPDGDDTRRHYRLTRFGRNVARAEAQRLTRAVKAARSKGLIIPGSA